MSIGRKPYPQRPANPRSFYIGFHGPYAGRVRRSDEDIKRDVESALFYDTWVNSNEINVEVKDGVVTLTGTVHAPVEKRSAEDDAWEVAGVRDVQNNLRIQIE